ncbi:MAG: HlyD family efflux transporter periplasmic adaptor subunit [Pseudomonadota bacterium]|nr:MAG: HlyD family efflux transporter periplasmic adaptor subunit [Pseudomonadota bacterium]
MQWRKHIGWVAIGATVLAAIAWGFVPRAVRVDVHVAARAPMVVTVEEEGKTRVIDRYVVSVPVAGFSRRLVFKVGDAVAQGQTLLELEPLRSEVLDPRRRAEAQARVAAARSALQAAGENARAAKAESEVTKLEYERRRKLSTQARISQEEVDKARAEMRRTDANRRSAEFNVELARYELQAAQTALKYSAARDGDEAPESVSIRAPVSGRILKVYRESEGVVNPGDPVVEIGDSTALEVEVDVLSADAVLIGPGTEVRFHRWGGDIPLDGSVNVVEPTGFTKISALGVEEQRVLVIADIISPTELWTRLGDGYRVEASFVIWQDDDVLQVPNSALFRGNDGWAVFVDDGGHARARTVRINHRNGLMAEVLEGITEGETVVVHPSDAVRNGVRIRQR